MGQLRGLCLQTGSRWGDEAVLSTAELSRSRRFARAPAPSRSVRARQVGDAALVCWKNEIKFPFCFAAAD